MFMSAPKRIAIKMALQSTSRFRVGCVIARGKRVLYAGYNQMGKSHPLSDRRGLRGIHAEVHCLLPAHGERITGEAYIARIRLDGSLGIARPCPDCIKALRQHGVKRINYTTQDGVWVQEAI